MQSNVLKRVPTIILHNPEFTYWQVI